MRRVTVIAAIAGACFALPCAASAQTSPLCVFGGGPWDYDYQLRLSPYLGEPSEWFAGGQAAQAARAALGAQYGTLWGDTPRQGWSVAFAPGPLDAAAARAAIVAELATRVDAETLAYLDGLLAVYPTPYGEAELKPVKEQVAELMSGPGRDLISSVGIGCNESDGVRVQVAIGPEGTPEVVAHASALLQPFGDKVHVTYGRGWAIPMHIPGLVPAPTPGPADTGGEAQAQPKTARVATYARLPKTSRCVRGRVLSVKAASRSDLRSVTLAAGKRRATAKAGKRARLQLKRSKTKVTVTVRLRDGRKAAQTFTYRRCG